MREAMQLPLACANVVHKVLHLIRTWLLQKEIPLFVESGHVSLESASLLMIHLLMSFFHSPYLVSSGDRLPSAISLTHNILQIVRDFSNPATGALSDPLPPTVSSLRKNRKTLSATGVERAHSTAEPRSGPVLVALRCLWQRHGRWIHQLAS